MPYSLDYRLRGRDGDYRWFRDSATPRQDSAGRFIGYIHRCLDITDRVEIETNLRAARQAAEAANRAKDAFLTNLGHEIRTPLNAVLGLCQLMLGDELTDRQRHYLTQIQTSATELFALLTDLLAYSKLMETGEVRRAPQPFRLRDLVANAVARFAHQARDQRLHLEVALDPTLPPILLGDPEGLQKILDCLVGNAVKFTAQGDIRVAVDLDPLDAAPDAPRDAATDPTTDLAPDSTTDFALGVPPDSYPSIAPASEAAASGELGPLPGTPTVAGADQTFWVRFTVSDTGIGLSPEQQGEIFTPFHQADMSLTRPHGGTGLGLGLSKRLVELMGGRIRVASSPGTGSTFWFSVPLGRPADLPETLPEASAASGHGTSPTVTGEGTNKARDVDLIGLLPKLAELDHSLAMGHARARQFNTEIVALLADTDLYAPYQDIAAAIGRLDYATASARLHHFIQEQG